MFLRENIKIENLETSVSIYILADPLKRLIHYHINFYINSLN